jgi:UPF0755 protein
MSKTKRSVARFLIVVGVLLLLGAFWFNRQLAPMPEGKRLFLRWDQQTSLSVVLDELGDKGIVRNPRILTLYARLRRDAAPVGSGTYGFKPGMYAGEILEALRKPVRQMVRLPARWIADNAKVLEEHDVAKAADYMALAKDPQAFQSYVKFPLPKKGTLEGYLYPDTYDLPPLYGAKNTIIRQLKTFEKKVYNALPKQKDFNRLLTVASMIQMEVARDDERPVVAGVIENRLRIGMRLQIDATCLYANQEWKDPKHADLVRVDSPYNTYLHGGLPPGPICSPSFKSIEAATKPAKHAYLYYVAAPGSGKGHWFGATLAEHNANIRRRRQMLGAAGR